MMKSGKPVEQASSEPIPSPFDTWLCLEDFFVTNLKFLCKLNARKRDKIGQARAVMAETVNFRRKGTMVILEEHTIV
jgi:hypothetical protein